MNEIPTQVIAKLPPADRVVQVIESNKGKAKVGIVKENDLVYDHAVAVIQANRRNISKEKERSQSWKERVVPIEASQTATENKSTGKKNLTLRESLEKQAELSKNLKK